MGAWGIKPFENDAASDWLNKINSKNLEERLQKVFEYKNLKRIGDDKSSIVIAASEIFVKYLTKSESHSKIIESKVQKIQESSLKPLAENAIQALNLVQSNKSELNELWEETEDYAIWKNINELFISVFDNFLKGNEITDFDEKLNKIYSKIKTKEPSQDEIRKIVEQRYLEKNINVDFKLYPSPFGKKKERRYFVLKGNEVKLLALLHKTTIVPDELIAKFEDKLPQEIQDLLDKDEMYLLSGNRHIGFEYSLQKKGLSEYPVELKANTKFYAGCFIGDFNDLNYVKLSILDYLERVNLNW